MKIKALLLATCAAAGMCFTSCSNENSPVDNERSENQAIAFGTYMAKPAVTKAGKTGCMTLDKLKESDAGFGVFAHYTGQNNYTAPSEAFNFMFNEAVKYKATTGPWEYSPVKYWPNTPGDKVSFFAYAPYVETPSESTGITAMSEKTVKGEPTLTYVIASNPNNIVDLLWAKKENQENTKKTTDGKVKFEFKHALSQIAFTVKTTVDGGTEGPASTKVYVESIKIDGGSLKNKGTLNLATGTWTIDGAATAASISGGTGNFTDAVKYPSSITNWASMATTGVTKDAQPLFEASNMFVIIPASTKIQVTIKYHVLTEDASLNKGFTDVPNEVTSGEIDLGTVAMNKKYTINMNLGLKTVVFDNPTVAEWEAETAETDVNLPVISTSSVK